MPAHSASEDPYKTDCIAIKTFRGVTLAQLVKASVCQADV